MKMSRAKKVVLAMIAGQGKVPNPLPGYAEPTNDKARVEIQVLRVRKGEEGRWGAGVASLRQVARSGNLATS